MSFLLNRLSQKRIWTRIYKERLSEPLHLNLISFFVLLFGSFRSKVLYDLVLRPHHAFSILKAADQAKERGFSEISVLEFGVAHGSGLMNMIKVAEKVTKTTGIKINIYGFDTGKGMPEPVDYRDHPEYYNTGDFPMNRDLLEDRIKGKAQLFIGPIKETLKEFLKTTSSETPIGFVSIDVDYYSSTMEVLELFKEDPNLFLPLTYIYFDDIFMENHNDKSGELLAIKEFNDTQKLRNIVYHKFLVNKRLFKNSNWTKQIYYLHVLDHPYRFETQRNEAQRVLDNPYLNI
ncbi:hypothetical protein HNV08_11900 [Winogradskyella eckloniae]|uniref:hypothetical protein n=1 Tax=Winogradskyella eckloniae TaxID=1089306 RepID=UPI001564A140|nr:hypothetical protein [Winogradskyella eckloniae]NRD20754.1 hypothetical protein [Winogradskyella eckloniae]